MLLAPGHVKQNGHGSVYFKKNLVHLHVTFLYQDCAFKYENFYIRYISYNIINTDTTYDGNKLTSWLLRISHDKDVN